MEDQFSYDEDVDDEEKYVERKISVKEQVAER